MRSLLGRCIAIAMLGLVLLPPGAGAIGGGVALSPTPTWNAHITFQPGNSGCSGALIARQWVLTAAHCVHKNDTGTLYKASDISISIGASTSTNGGFTSSVDRAPISHAILLVTHKGYINDIALLHLAKPAPSSYEALPLRFSPSAVPSGSPVQMVGWGQNGRTPTGRAVFSTKPGDWTFTDSCATNGQVCYYPSASATSYPGNVDSGAPVISYVRGGWIEVGLLTGPGGITPPQYGASALSYLSWIRANAGLPTVAANTIVRDSASGASWLVEDDGFRHWIPTGADYNCFTRSGIPLRNMSIFDAKSIPEDHTSHATCTPSAPGSHTGLQVKIDRHATGGVSGHTGPGNSYATGPTRPANSPIWIVCYVNGQSITGPYDTTTIWDLSDDGFYYTDAWLYTGTNNAVVPACSPPPPPSSPSIAISNNGGQMVVQLHAFPTGTSYYFCHSGDPSAYPLGGTITGQGQVQVTSSEQSWSSGWCSGSGNAWVGIQATDGHDYYSNEVTLAPASPPPSGSPPQVGLRVQIDMGADGEVTHFNGISCVDSIDTIYPYEMAIATLSPSIEGWVTAANPTNYPDMFVTTEAAQPSTPDGVLAFAEVQSPDGTVYPLTLAVGAVAGYCPPVPPVGDVPVGASVPFDIPTESWTVTGASGCLTDVTLSHTGPLQWRLTTTLGPSRDPSGGCPGG